MKQEEKRPTNYRVTIAIIATINTVAVCYCKLFMWVDFMFQVVVVVGDGCTVGCPSEWKMW